jgi:hypothetical protein
VHETGTLKKIVCETQKTERGSQESVHQPQETQESSHSGEDDPRPANHRILNTKPLPVLCVQRTVSVRLVHSVSVGLEILVHSHVQWVESAPEAQHNEESEESEEVYGEEEEVIGPRRE